MSNGNGTLRMLVDAFAIFSLISIQLLGWLMLFFLVTSLFENV